MENNGYLVCEAYWVARYKTLHQFKFDNDKHKLTSKIFQTEEELKMRLGMFVHKKYLCQFELYDQLYIILKNNSILDYFDYFSFIITKFKDKYNLKEQFYISPKFFMRKECIDEYHRSFANSLIDRHSGPLYYTTLNNIISSCKKNKIKISTLLSNSNRKKFKEMIFGQILKNKFSVFVYLGIFDQDEIMDLPKYKIQEFESKFKTPINKLISIGKILLHKRFKSYEHFIRFFEKL